jgi:hypothetical protein
MRHLLQQTRVVGDNCPICRTHCDTRAGFGTKAVACLLAPHAAGRHQKRRASHSRSPCPIGEPGNSRRSADDFIHAMAVPGFYVPCQSTKKKGFAIAKPLSRRRVRFLMEEAGRLRQCKHRAANMRQVWKGDTQASPGTSVALHCTARRTRYCACAEYICTCSPETLIWTTGKGMCRLRQEPEPSSPTPVVAGYYEDY